MHHTVSYSGGFYRIPRIGDHTDSFTQLRDPENYKHMNCMGCWKEDINILFQGFEPMNQHQKFYCHSQGMQPWAATSSYGALTS